MATSIRSGDQDELLPIYGRSAEQGRLAELLERSGAGRSTFLWIEGDPGTGKTALVNGVLRNLPGWVVVRVISYEGETDLSLATLTSVVLQLRPWAEELSPQARQILDNLLSGGTLPPDLFGLGMMVLSLIAEAAEQQPVAVFIDDAHWTDSASAAALGFAARRLDADSVAFIMAARPAAPPGLRPQEDMVLSLGPIDDTSARSVLDEYGEWAPEVTESALRHASGNPLILRDTARRLTPDQRLGLQSLPALDSHPGSSSLISVGRLADLDSATRAALALVAAAGSDPQAVERALQVLGLRSDLLKDAVRTGVLRTTRHGFEFTHPLLRSAALTSLDSELLGQIHGAIAGLVSSSDRQAHHLALAQRGPSAGIADQLTRQADTDLNTRGPAAAASLYLQAARLTPTGPTRRARVLTAASVLVASGRPDEARQCIEELVSEPALPLVDKADAVMLWTAVATFGGDAAVAAAEATKVADAIDATDQARALGLRSGAVYCLMAVGDVRSALALFPGSADLESLHDGTKAYVLALAGDAEAIRRVRSIGRRALEALDSDQDLLNPAVANNAAMFAQALNWSESYVESMALNQRLVDQHRRAMAPGLSVAPLAVLSDPELRLGLWDLSTAHAEEARRLAEDTGQPLLGTYMRALIARVAAARGQRGTVLSECEAIFADCERFDVTPPKLYAYPTLGLLELSDGAWDESAEYLERAEQLANEIGYDSVAAVPYRADLVEALFRAGRVARALTVLEAFEEQAERCQSDWAAASCGRLRGMINADASSDDLFGGALELWPRDDFDAARTRLAWAYHRQKQGDPDQAERLARDAISTFERLRATPWVARAAALIKSGAERREATSPFAQLTARELQVALAIARGLTNRQAADQLFMSNKTIEHHITRAYRKLGVRSRAQLTRAVMNEPSLSDRVRTDH